MNPARGQILLEDARVLAMHRFADEQYVIEIKAPRIASKATAGSFVHLTCSAQYPMRRPLSLQRVDPKNGVLEILFKAVGRGTRALSAVNVGDPLSCLGPIGRGFELDPTRPRPLLIGGGVGIPPMIYLSETLAQLKSAASPSSPAPDYKPFVVLGSEIPFPFQARPSTILVPHLAADVIAAHPLCEDFGIASRLASNSGFAGCYEGYVTQLAEQWLQGLSEAERNNVAIYSCGPTPMLKAVAQLAARYHLPAQVSLEEYMACAVGGCAGCVVKITTPEGPKMQRVCVDGPVFDAHQVVFDD